MKTKFLILLALVCGAFMTSSTQDLNKDILGEWCNPYTYQSSGEIKGFNFKKGGKCQGINVPTLDLKTWVIENGYLIINGESINENGGREVYKSKERISKLSKDTLMVVSKEENPRLEFLYVRIPIAKKAFPDVVEKKVK